MNEQQECQVVGHLVSALSVMCASNPDKVIDLLTGYLWSEEEAGRIKKAIIEGEGK
jgi:hypothetical protein